MADPHRVFVYGTFLPGQERWALLEPFVDTVDDATAEGTLWDTRRGYPAALFDGNGRVPGVVLSMKAETWDEVVALMDQIEGEGMLYRRVQISTSVGMATSYEWMGSTNGMTPLPNGWRRGRA